MAVYVFKCKSCGEEFTKSMLISVFKETIKKTKQTECPECGGWGELIPASTNFQLTGTGWYVTDYKNKSNETKKKNGS